jgi:hypothetical protein
MVKTIMTKKEMKYVKKQNNNSKLIRTEILLAPILLIIPFAVGIFLINDWYIRGYLLGNSTKFLGELIIGIVIIFGNIIFDFSFIKSLKKLSSKIN